MIPGLAPTDFTNLRISFDILLESARFFTASPIEDLSYNDPDYLPKKGTSDEELLQI